MAHGGGIAGRLYRGDVSINFVRRQRLWYMISGIILLVSVVALLVQGAELLAGVQGRVELHLPGQLLDHPGRDLPGGDPVRAAATPPCSSPRGALHQWTVQTGTLTSQATQQVAAALEQAFHVTAEQDVDPARRPDLGRPDHQQGGRGADHLPRGDRHLPVDRLRVADGRGGVHRADARHPDHHRRVRADRLLGQPDVRHRPADDPRLLALRHRGRLRQGAGEYRRPAHHADTPPTATRPTWRSTRPWSGRSTPR